MLGEAGTEWLVTDGPGKAGNIRGWLGVAEQAWRGTWRLGTARLARQDWLGLAWQGPGRLGAAGSDRQGKAGLGQALDGKGRTGAAG